MAFQPAVGNDHLYAVIGHPWTRGGRVPVLLGVHPTRVQAEQLRDLVHEDHQAVIATLPRKIGAHTVSVNVWAGVDVIKGDEWLEFEVEHDDDDHEDYPTYEYRLKDGHILKMEP